MQWNGQDANKNGIYKNLNLLFKINLSGKIGQPKPKPQPWLLAKISKENQSETDVMKKGNLKL